MSNRNCSTAAKLNYRLTVAEASRQWLLSFHASASLAGRRLSLVASKARKAVEWCLIIIGLMTIMTAAEPYLMEAAHVPTAQIDLGSFCLPDESQSI